MSDSVSITLQYPLAKNPYYRISYNVLDVQEDANTITFFLVDANTNHISFVVQKSLENYNTQTFLAAIAEWSLGVDKITYNFDLIKGKNIMITWQDYVNYQGAIFNNIRSIYVFPDQAIKKNGTEE